MKIPTLSTAFCGFSLRFGVMTIAWLQIVTHVLIIILVGFTILSSATAATDKELSADPYETGLYKQFHFKITDDNEEEEYDRIFKKHLVTTIKNLGIITISVLAMAYFLHFTAAVLLLFGAQKRQPGFLVFWIVLTMLGMLVAIQSMTYEGFFYILIHLYFTWVVSSFYRQLDENQDSPRQLEENEDYDLSHWIRGEEALSATTQHVPGQSKLEVDKSVYVIPDAPPPYSYI